MWTCTNLHVRPLLRLLILTLWQLGEAASSFFIVSFYFLTSEHFRTFMLPFLFSFRNINDATASALCFFVGLVASIGARVSRAWSFISYFVSSYPPRYLNFFSTYLSSYCGMTMWSMWLSLSSLVVSVFRWMYPLSLFLPAMAGITLVHFYCLWLGILLVFICGVPIRLWSPFHCYIFHHFLLVSGMVCLIMVVLLTRVCHCPQHRPHHPHNQVQPQLLGRAPPHVLVVLGLFEKCRWEICCHHTLLWYF